METRRKAELSHRKNRSLSNLCLPPTSDLFRFSLLNRRLIKRRAFRLLTLSAARAIARSSDICPQITQNDADVFPCGLRGLRVGFGCSEQAGPEVWRTSWPGTFQGWTDYLPNTYQADALEPPPRTADSEVPGCSGAGFAARARCRQRPVILIVGPSIAPHERIAYRNEASETGSSDT